MAALSFEREKFCRCGLQSMLPENAENVSIERAQLISKLNFSLL